MTELAGLDPHMHLDLFHAQIEDAHAAAVPPHPDLAANVFGSHLIVGFGHLDIAITVDAALCLLVTRKERRRQRFEMSALFFKASFHLTTRGAVDAFTGNVVFPMSQKEVLFCERTETASLQGVVLCVGDRSLHLSLVLRCSRTTR